VIEPGDKNERETELEQAELDGLLSGRVLPAVLIVLIVLVGSYVRLVDLDQDTFFGDELDHYYGAMSLLNGQGPELPSGIEYRRGIDFTRLVALSVERVQSPEVGARLPSAVLGCIALVVVALIAWQLVGPWAAVWATFLLAVYPEAIIQSRQVRFYTYQLTFCLVGMFAAWRFLKESAPSGRDTGAYPRAAWLWAALALAGLGLAARVQLTTLSLAAAAGLALLAGTVGDVSWFGRSAIRRSSRLHLFLLGGTGMAIMVLVKPGLIPRLVSLASFVPSWAGGSPGDPRAYYWALAEQFPLVVGLAPVALLTVALRRSWALALYLAFWFGVPFALHSFIFPWKGERYILAAVPALFLMTGVLAADGFGYIRTGLTEALRSSERWRIRSGQITVAALAFVAVLIGVLTPAVFTALRIPSNPKDFDWHGARNAWESEGSDEQVVVGSSVGLPALYYWERLDFVVGSDFVQVTERYNRSLGIEKPLAILNDFYSGRPVLTHPDVIRDAFPNEKIVIVVDENRWRFGNIDKRLMEALEQDGVELCKGACKGLRVYSWPVERDVPDPLTPSGQPEGEPSGQEPSTGH
jgi:hypothetical protein